MQILDVEINKNGYSFLTFLFNEKNEKIEFEKLTQVYLPHLLKDETFKTRFLLEEFSFTDLTFDIVELDEFVAYAVVNKIKTEDFIIVKYFNEYEDLMATVKVKIDL